LNWVVALFHKTLVAKTWKKYYLERVRLRTQFQHFQSSDRKFSSLSAETVKIREQTDGWI
jgi:hypothetical protein